VVVRITRQDLLERMRRAAPLVLVEALGAAYYADAHLPSAVNVPPHLVDQLAPRLLPDRDVPVVVYGSGRSGLASAEATAVRLDELGYREVAVYADGKEDWVEHGLPVERLALGPDGGGCPLRGSPATGS
jgi:rhodanese-related sulfurtransferase